MQVLFCCGRCVPWPAGGNDSARWYFRRIQAGAIADATSLLQQTVLRRTRTFHDCRKAQPLPRPVQGNQCKILCCRSATPAGVHTGGPWLNQRVVLMTDGRDFQEQVCCPPFLFLPMRVISNGLQFIIPAVRTGESFPVHLDCPVKAPAIVPAHYISRHRARLWCQLHRDRIHQSPSFDRIRVNRKIHRPVII